MMTFYSRPFSNLFLSLVKTCFFLLTLLWVGLASSQEHEKVTIQLKWQHQFQFAGFYAAKEKGFYEEEGLAVDLRQRNPETSYIDDVLQGLAQYGVADASLAIERIQGKPLVLLAQIFQHSPLIFMTLKSSGLEEAKDLTNTRIMYDLMGHSDISLTTLLLNTVGSLDAIKRNQLSFNLQDLIDGKVDVYAGYTTAQPFWFYERNVDINIINPRDYGIDYYGDNLFTTEKELTEHPLRVEKVRRATLKGWRYALAHKAEIIDLILAKYNSQKLSRAHLEFEAEESVKLIVPSYIEIGSYDPTRFQKMVNAYVRTGLIQPSKLPKIFFYQVKPKPQLINLTKKEKQWLDEHPVLLVGNSTDWPPIGFINEDGVYSGLAADYLNYIGRLLGVEIKPAKLKTWSDTVAAVRLNNIDLLDAAAPTPQRDEFLTFTKAYLGYPLVIVTGREVGFIAEMSDLDGKMVAVISGSAAHDLLLKNHPEYQLYLVDSVSEGLMAVEKDGIVYIGDIATVGYTVGHEGFANSKISGETPYRYDLSIAVNKANPILASIMQKALTAIPDEKRHEIQRKWLSVTFEHKINYTLIKQVLFGVVIVLIAFLVWNRRMAKEVSQRRVAEERLNQANEALSKSESYLKFALEAAKAGTFIFDYETNYLKWDERCYKIFGITSNCFSHRYDSWLRLICKEDLHEIQSAIEIQLKAEQQLDIQYKCIRPDGKTCHVWTVANILRDHQGKPLKLIGLHFDDTELVLTQQALVKSKERAELANQVKNEFLANMSHELRTPMHSILSFSGLGEDKIESASKEKLKQYFTRIHQSGERLMPLLNDLLDLSKLEAGHIEFDKKQGDIRLLAKVIIEEFSTIIMEKSISITLDSSVIDTVAEYDHDKLLQVFRNLIANAIKYTPGGRLINIDFAEAEISADLNQGDEKKIAAIAVSVIDQGIGIPEDELKTVFDKFIQSSKTKTGGGGTGLGLAICEEIISGHNGRIWAENNPSGGARFTFVIPRYAQDTALRTAHEIT